MIITLECDMAAVVAGVRPRGGLRAVGCTGGGEGREQWCLA